MNKKTSSRPTGVAAPLVALLGLMLVLSACDHVVGPRAEFTIMDQDHGYPPLEVTLDASASSSPNGAIVSYDWDLGDGETDSGVTVTHTYAKKGIYEITLVVTDSAGEIGARARSVEALNHAPVAVFTFSPFWVGANQPLTLNASDSYDPDGEIVQYIWSFGDGSSGEGMVVQHEYAVPGWTPLVTLTVVDEDGGPNSTSRQVNVVGCAACGG